MIPPEPDPPEPTVPEYTYATSSQISLGAVTGTLYTDIQYNGSNCYLNAEGTIYDGIILYDDVLQDPQCYYVHKVDNDVYFALLGSNAEIGLYNTYYRISNGNVSSWGTVNLQSSTPSDYFENIRNRNFTLVQRS